MSGLYEEKFPTANWGGIPRYCRASLRRWIEEGTEVGDFLTAVLSNDLRKAVCYADEDNRKALLAYVHFLHTDAPSECWGSPEKLKAWKEAGGLAGIERRRAAP